MILDLFDMLSGKSEYAFGISFYNIKSLYTVAR